MTLSKGSSRGKLKLSARVPRLSYLSGQPCYVHIQVLNDTHKTVRALCLTLIRTTTVYRPQSGKGNRRDEHGRVSNKYQSKSFVDTIAESRLAVAERTTRKCASSRGWWAGVGPQERTGFTHSISIPVCPCSSIIDYQVNSFQMVCAFSRMRSQLRAQNSSPSITPSVLPPTLLRVRWG